MPAMVTHLPSLARRSCNGVLPVLCVASAAAMRPNSVCMPTAVTTIRPVPAVT